MQRALVLTSVLAFAAVLSAPSFAHAQVNVEGLRKDLRHVPAVAAVAATFTGRTGNTQSVETGGSAQGAARAGQWHTFLASTQAEYARYGSTTTVSKSFVHLRYNYEFLPWLIGEAFVQQQQDKFQRLLLRELAGVGPRFVLADEEESRVAIGTAGMVEYERIAVAPGTPDQARTVDIRLSNYVTGIWQPDSRVRLLGTIYVQPRVDRWSDVRVLFEATAQTQLTKRVSIKVIGTARHDSEPPTLVKKTDLEIKNAFALTF